MRKFRDIAIIVLLVFSTIGVIILLLSIYRIQDPTPRENLFLSILLFILSSVSAVIVSYYFTRMGTSEKLDTIATASAEKMVHLSLQLQHLSEYLLDTQTIVAEEIDIDTDAALSAYRHRVDASADIAASLAASNETFRNDWLGIVSEDTRKVIETKYENLHDYLQDAETYKRLQRQRETARGSAEEEVRVSAELRKIEERLENARRALPSQPLTSARTPRPPAVDVSQEISEATSEAQEGILRVRLLRSVYAATGSGKLDPEMDSSPRIDARLVESPPSLDTEHLNISSKSGTTFDFHIHLKSTVFGVSLPLGDYVFEYSARTPAIFRDERSEKDSAD